MPVERKAREAETRKIIDGGKCPKCGADLRRNGSMAGWWQCEQYGSDGWRQDSAKPECNWQGLTS